MVDRPKIGVDVIFNNRDARDFANKFGGLLSETAKKWRDNVEKTSADGLQAGLQLALASGQSGKAIQTFLSTNIKDVHDKFMKEVRAGNLEEAEKLERILTTRTQRFQKEVDAITEAFDAMQKRQSRTFEEGADAFGEKVQKLQSGLTGGLEGFVGFARGGGGALQRMGRERQGRAMRIRDIAEKEGRLGDVKKADQMAKLGRTLATVGKAAAGFAAVAGAILLLVKLFADLEAKVKEMNKEMLASAGAADFGFSHVELVSGKLAKQLERMRSETTALNQNFMRFRAGAQEQQKILNQFNQAGFTFAKMNQEIALGADKMRSFSDVTALALTYARNLGVDSGEIADKMGEFAFTTGASLRDIAEQFSIISREALLAGFVTKRFYSAIIEVTSGMAFYGLRIEETTKLLKSFDSLLGEAVGTEAFKRLVGQYKDKGAQDRLRDFIIKDQEFAQEQFAKAFERQVAQLGRDFKEIGLNEKQLRDLLKVPELEMTARLQAMGLGPEEIQRFRGTALVGGAARGGIGAMTRAAPFAGPGFDVAMAAQAGPIFGGMRVDEVLRRLSEGAAGAAELAALEQVTGKSLEELEQLGALFTNAEGALRNLERIQRMMAEGTPLSDKDRDLLESYQTKLGLYIDAQTGQIMKGEFDSNKHLIEGTGVAVKDALQVVAETSTTGEQQIEEQLTKDQEIAKEISSNITGLNEIMEQSVIGVLNEIYEVLVAIANVVTSDRPEAARVAATEAARAERKRAEEAAEKARQDELDARETLEKAQRVGDKKQIEVAQEQLAEAQRQSQHIQKRIIAASTAEQAAKTLTEETIDKQGHGFSTLVDAVEAGTGEQKFLNESMQKSFAGALETALPRDLEAISDPWSNVGKALTTGGVGLAFSSPTDSRDPDEWAKAFVDQLAANPDFLRQAGGRANLQAAAQAGLAAVKAHEDYGDVFYTKWNLDEMASAFSAAASQSLAATMPSVDDQKQMAAEQQAKMEEIRKAITEGAFVEALFGSAWKANDLIIPAGGRPIMTHEQDTIVAGRPGGPIARGAGATARGNVVVNIYGGDQRKTYDTVMRVMKATGNA